MLNTAMRRLAPYAGLATIGLGGLALNKEAQRKEEPWNPNFPTTEKPKPLFNGNDLNDFDLGGDSKFVVVDGEIIGRTDQKMYGNRHSGVVHPQSNVLSAESKSVNLLSKQEFRDFRLTFEGKLATNDSAKVLSGVSFWGRKFKLPGNKDSVYSGSLACCLPKPGNFYEVCEQQGGSSSGYWLKKDKRGNSQRSEIKSWDKFEILVKGDRVQMAVNGKVTMDWVDPDPEYRQKGPIGLQLHWDKAHAQVHWRNLQVSENPSDSLISA